MKPYIKEGDNLKIAAMELRLYAPWVHSLKEKRMVVKSLLGKIRIVSIVFRKIKILPFGSR